MGIPTLREHDGDVSLVWLFFVALLLSDND